MRRPRPDRRGPFTVSEGEPSELLQGRRLMSKSLRAQIGILILATTIIQLANGFFGTFISLRVAMEDFGPTVSGLVLSSYFAGFTLGALRCERIIERVGHIRAYAAFAGMVVAATAAMPLLTAALPWSV